ncbi:MAG: hypothetical protein ACJ75Z_15160 [Solirubrobacterales bacterium]
MNRPVRRVIVLLGISALAAIATSAVAGASGPVATTSGKLPLLVGNCAKPKFKPATVILACGDASLGATNVVWTAWTKKAAVGNGTGQLNDCNPNCAQGKTKTAPMTLRASKPQTCSNGKRIFTKLAYTWTTGAPVGNVPDHGSAPVGCKLIGLKPA